MTESLSEHTFARQLAPLRAEPSDEAEQVTQALPGEPLRVLEESGELGARGDRLRVSGLGATGRPRRRARRGLARAARAADPVDARAHAARARSYEWGGMTSSRDRLLRPRPHVVPGLRAPGAAGRRPAGGGRREAPGRELRAGDLVTYGPPAGADHVAFWVGDGRILHATGRDGVDGVVEEEEPPKLRDRRRALFGCGSVRER